MWKAAPLVSRLYPAAYASAQAVLAPFRSAGLGAEVYGQANAGLSTAGFRVFLAVGRFR